MLSVVAIIPYGYFWNKYAGDIIENISDIFGKYELKAISIAVTTPATIWFFVKLDISIPNDIYDIDTNKNPINVVNTVCILVIFPANIHKII